MGNIIHIEFTAASVDESVGFASAVFGWTATPSPFIPDYVIVGSPVGEGIGGAIMSDQYQHQPVIAWIEVADIDRTIADAIAAGGASAGPINEIPGQGRVTYITDPAGVVYGLRQPEQATEHPAVAPI